VKVYFGSKSNKYYILCPDFNECYVFNMFGTLERKDGSIGSCDSWTEVDFLSFVSIDGGKCEMLFNDEKVVINESIQSCAMKIRKVGGYLGTMFTVSHSDDGGSFTQVCFVARKGTNTKGILEGNFVLKEWKKLV